MAIFILGENVHQRRMHASQMDLILMLRGIFYIHLLPLCLLYTNCIYGQLFEVITINIDCVHGQSPTAIHTQWHINLPAYNQHQNQSYCQHYILLSFVRSFIHSFINSFTHLFFRRFSEVSEMLGNVMSQNSYHFEWKWWDPMPLWEKLWILLRHASTIRL